MANSKELSLSKIIGFNGYIYRGLLVNRDEENIVFALGCTVIVENILTGQQHFLSGSLCKISCLAISNDGQFVAAGCETFMGFKSNIYIWNYATKTLHCEFQLHKVKTLSLSFTCDSSYLVSLGGQDDGTVVVWNVQKKEALCGSPAQAVSSGCAQVVLCSTNDPRAFITGGNGTLRVWTLQVDMRMITPNEVSLGQSRRSIISMTMEPGNNKIYCGTTTGDIIIVDVGTSSFHGLFPKKDKFCLGVTSLAVFKSGNVIVGSGDGKLVELELKNKTYSKKRQLDLPKAVTSVSLRGVGHQIYIGTSNGHVYRLNYNSFNCDLFNTTHQHPINDVTFAPYCSDLFLTCSFETIRVWHTKENKELLRIMVPNMTCNCLAVTMSGNCILGGFNDGRIRGFYPKSGRSLFSMEYSHSQGVTALAVMMDETRIMSGGGEGQIRIWKISSECQKLLFTLKEHKATVTCIKIRSDDREAISSSKDGTCIIWDMERFARRQIIFATTLFHCLSYDYDEVQIIASGSDRQIGYWEVYDGSAIRQVMSSDSGAINGIDVSSCGKYFVTAGDDKLVKLWSYDKGTVLFVGKGHGSSILKVKICPHSRYIVTVASDGSIFKWEFPTDLVEAEKPGSVCSANKVNESPQNEIEGQNLNNVEEESTTSRERLELEGQPPAESNNEICAA